MGYFQRYGSFKPSIITQLDYEHPFSQDARLILTFNESSFLSGRVRNLVPQNIGFPDPYIFPVTMAAIGTPTPGFNSEGSCMVSPTAGDYLTAGNDQHWVPTTSFTCAIIRRKLDTTNRNTNRLFEATSGGGTDLCYALCPYSDGVVYFDFGGTSSPNRLS